MNGSENSYAGALFFALISLGAALKIDDVVTGGVIGAVAALLAAINLRRALNRSAQAAEEDHQRIEVQFQQLRSKIVETSTANITAMSSLNDVTQLLRENLQIIREQSNSMEDLIELIKNAESINSLVASLEENSSALNSALEKILVAIQSQESFSEITAELKNLAALEETNTTNLQNTLEMLQDVAQTLKAPTYTKELEKINSSIQNLGAVNSNLSKNFNAKIGTLDALQNSTGDINKNLSALVKINAHISKTVATALDDLRFEILQLSDKLDPADKSSKKDKTPLTAEDIDLLKKIVAKINPK